MEELIKAIQEAVLSANRISEEQHLKVFSDYFDSNHNPVCVEVRVPEINGEEKERIIKIPLITLLPMKSLKLSSVEMECKVKLKGSHESEVKTEKGVLNLRLPAGRGEGSMANLKLKFTSQDPPEALLQLRDEYIRMIS